MSILKPVLILAILGSALLCADAYATEPPPRVGAEPGEVRKQAKSDVLPQPKAALAKKPPKRRAVAAQLDDGMTPPSYGPRLTAPAARAPGSLAPPVSSIPPGPVILNGCPNGHCIDQSGARYNPVGTTLISPHGRLCSDNGISVSCY